jgi:hypothetical protein
MGASGGELMAGYALADALADFAQRPRRAPGGPQRAERAPEKQDGPSIDIEALLAEERARAEQAAGERFGAEKEAALSAERERHRAEIAEISRRHGEESGARLEAGLREMEARVTGTVSDAVARILGPIVSDDVLKRGIGDLARAIGEALEDPDAVAIRVSGPLSLFSALASKMGEKSKYLRHRETDGVDLTVEVNGGLLETRLGEWQASLREALE